MNRHLEKDDARVGDALVETAPSAEEKSEGNAHVEAALNAWAQLDLHTQQPIILNFPLN